MPGLDSYPIGPIAQLGERRVRNAEVGSSILLRSTNFPSGVSDFFEADFSCFCAFRDCLRAEVPASVQSDLVFRKL